MNKKSCLGPFIFTLLVAAVSIIYIYDKYQYPSGGPRSQNTGFTIARIDNLGASANLPINTNNTELFGFVFDPPSPLTSSTDDVLVKKINFKITVTSSLAALNAHIRRLKLVSNGDVLAIAQNFTSTTIHFNDLDLVVARNQSVPVSLVADTRTSPIHGNVQFKIDYIYAENSAGDEIAIIRLPDGSFLTPSFPLPSALFYF